MSKWFELWDADNASLIDTFDSQDKVITMGQRQIQDFGLESVDSWVLTRESASDDGPDVIAAGRQLGLLMQTAHIGPYSDSGVRISIEGNIAEGVGLSTRVQMTGTTISAVTSSVAEDRSLAQPQWTPA